jgi:hypothetical protein
MTKAWKPRITVEVSEHQYNILKEHIPYGMQKQVLGVLFEEGFNFVER